MNMDSAAVFLAGSLLYALGLLIILCGIIIGNNLIFKYWKSFGWKLFPTWIQDNPRFVTAEEAEKLEPVITKEKEK